MPRNTTSANNRARLVAWPTPSWTTPTPPAPTGSHQCRQEDHVAAAGGLERNPAASRPPPQTQKLARLATAAIPPPPPLLLTSKSDVNASKITWKSFTGLAPSSPVREMCLMKHVVSKKIQRQSALPRRRYEQTQRGQREVPKFCSTKIISHH